MTHQNGIVAGQLAKVSYVDESLSACLCEIRVPACTVPSAAQHRSELVCDRHTQCSGRNGQGGRQVSQRGREALAQLQALLCRVCHRKIRIGDQGHVVEVVTACSVCNRQK